MPLLQRLEDAFGDLSLPSYDEIVYDNSDGHLECRQIRAAFARRHWRELSTDDIVAEPEALAFFTVQAFQFYLPAFIRASLLDPEGADLIPDRILASLATPGEAGWWGKHGRRLPEAARGYGIPEQVVSELAPRDGPVLDIARKARVAALTPAQKQVVREFIAFLRKNRASDFRFEELERAEAALLT